MAHLIDRAAPTRRGSPHRPEAQRYNPIVTLPRAAVVTATLVVAALLGALAGSGKDSATLAVIGLSLMMLGTTVTLTDPRVVYGALAFVIGAAPMMIAPGIPLPFILVLAAAMWCAILTHPIANTRIHGLEIAMAFLIVASTIGMIMMAYGTKAHIMEYIKWLLACSVVFAIARLSRADAAMFGRVYVYGATLGTAFAVALRQFDSSGTVMNRLSLIGYGNTGTIGTHLRTFESSSGDVVRLTGTYVDPNLAGIFIFVALALSIALFRGPTRLVLATLLAIGLVVTLSRAAMFSAVAAVILMVLFAAMRNELRLRIVAGVALLGAVALSIPSISERILSSFSSEDKGTTDRAEALRRFLGYMNGHWLFGHGFGAKEFTDEVAGWNVNYVANSPLLTIYRAGILAGIAFIALLVVGAVKSFRDMRRTPWESGVIGAAFVGFSVVALQLDFPVVTHAPATMAFSVLVAMLMVNPVEQVPTQNGSTAAPGATAHSDHDSTSGITVSKD